MHMCRRPLLQADAGRGDQRLERRRAARDGGGGADVRPTVDAVLSVKNAGRATYSKGVGITRVVL